MELERNSWIAQNVDLGCPDTFCEGAPIGFLDQLRTSSPIVWHESDYENKGFWVVTSEALYQEVVRNPDVYSSELRTVKLDDPTGQDLERQRHFLLNMDPPKHRAYRKMVSQMFTVKKIEALQSFFQKTATDIFDSVDYGSKCDVIEELANEMPLQVISHIIGLGDVSIEEKKSLANAVHVILYPEEPSYRGHGNANTQAVKLFSKGLSLYTEHSAGSVESLMSVLVNGEADGETLSKEEFIFQYLFMYVAGYETTRSVIASAVNLFCTYPEQYQVLRSNPELLEGAIEEILRFESTHWHHCRSATKNVNLGGVDIKQGEKIALFYHAINRDPAINDAPQNFDVTRKDAQHRSFGYGIHLCLGAYLARQELLVFLSEMIRRVKHIESYDNVVRARSSFLNGYVNMDVVLHA